MILNQSNKVELQYFGDSILPCVFVVFLFLLNQYCEQQTSRSTCKDSWQLKPFHPYELPKEMSCYDIITFSNHQVMRRKESISWRKLLTLNTKFVDLKLWNMNARQYGEGTGLCHICISLWLRINKAYNKEILHILTVYLNNFRALIVIP